MREIIRPESEQLIMLGLQAAKIIPERRRAVTERETNDGCRASSPVGGDREERRSPVGAKHFFVRIVHHKDYQIAAVYEDCSEADLLRINRDLDTVDGLVASVGPSMLQKAENEVIGERQLC